MTCVIIIVIAKKGETLEFGSHFLVVIVQYNTIYMCFFVCCMYFKSHLTAKSDAVFRRSPLMLDNLLQSNVS